MKPIVLTIPTLLFLSATSFAQPGTLDKTFSADGIAYYKRVTGEPVVAALQADNKIVVTATYYNTSDADFSVIRFNSNGQLDKTFGNNGFKSTDFGNRDLVKAIAIQPDGKIIVAGTTEDNSSHYKIAMVRYTSAGDLDLSFGNNGEVVTDRSGHGIPTALILQPDGKILLADGDAGGAFYVLRYTENGKPDSSFGNNGVATALFLNPTYYPYSYCQSLALQPDGKIVAAGTVYFEENSLGYENFALARFTPNGTVDNSFNGYGRTMYDYEADCNAVAITPSGKIVMAGYNTTTNSNFMLLQYKADGKLDSSFGTNGRMLTAFSNVDIAYAVTVQPDGKIVAAGFSDWYYGPAFSLNIARYNADGQPDYSFGDSGKVTTTYNDYRSSGIGGSVIIQPDGKIIQSGNSDSGITVIRYNGDNVLPLNIVNIQAFRASEAVAISWTAMNESSTASYDVEHSADGRTFTTLGNTKVINNGQQTNNYSFPDPSPLKGNNFYRIKVNDKSGSAAYSKVVQLIVIEGESGITLYPNPVKNVLHIQGLTISVTSIIVMDAKGKIIEQLSAPVNNYSINTTNYAAGVYFIKITEPSMNITLKFVKE